jgi:2-polyprenyl-6-methoxyphenol hydroxylase-like FAD-dependent oxidoreductase
MTAGVDVAILGGGPGGAATAIGLARRGLEVAVLQAQPGAHRKTVETLPPPARPLLEYLGVWDKLSRDGHSPVYGARSRWGSDNVKETSYVFHPHGHGWRLDRR